MTTGPAKTRSAGQSPRAARPSANGQPRGTFQSGGTRAVKEVRREKAHQRFVGGLSTEERSAYEQGGQQAEQAEQARQQAKQQADQDARSARRRAQVSAVVGRPVSTLDSGAGFILGLLVWGWVALPFLTGGPTGVRNVLRAKFFNKAPDGSWLP